MSTTKQQSKAAGLSADAKAAVAAKTAKGTTPAADVVKPEHVITAVPVQRGGTTPSSQTKRRVPRQAAAKTKADEKAKAEAPAPDALEQLVAAVTTALAVEGVITGRLERNKVARDEATTLATWTENGSKGKRPATPNLDLLNAHQAAKDAGAKVAALPDTSTPRAPKKEKEADSTPSAGGTPKAPATNSSGSERLAPGALNDVVLAHLQANAGEALGPSQVAKAIDRSSGAVAKALVRLVAAGTVQAAGTAPLRYRVAKGATKASTAA
jgi:hypothetical protein